MKPTRNRNTRSASKFGKQKFSPSRLRITSGDMGGRKIAYNGDPATRPMKERTREAVFSLLGGKLGGQFAIDLFGGTGILAFESVSRGAEAATVLELSRPAVSTIIENLKALDIAEKVKVHHVDSLRWLRDFEKHREGLSELPWIVFLCPPYRMWTAESERLVLGIRAMFDASPSGSRFVCETDKTFDIPEALPEFDWDARFYDPATIALMKKE